MVGNFTHHSLDEFNEIRPIEFPVTIVIILAVLVTNLITKLCKLCLVVMACWTMLAGMKVSITGKQNSHMYLKRIETLKLKELRNDLLRCFCCHQ